MTATLGPYLMAPIRNAPLDSPEGRYTACHCQTRNCVEHLFGVMKSEWRVPRLKASFSRVLNALADGALGVTGCSSICMMECISSSSLCSVLMCCNSSSRLMSPSSCAGNTKKLSGLPAVSSCSG
uniref:Transposase n=1 Tax=Timema poppense TaxID=170557 RepID=A0A7R9H312_TIMPO|nr:unnamed protein product [Timema poppensis]